MVDEKGKDIYYISSEYDYNKASDWVKENVIKPLYISVVHGDNRNRFSVSNFHKEYGHTNEYIAKRVALFCGCYEDHLFWRSPPNVEFYGYYADYDWVVFCSLFGRMIDLPKGFPMYCRDLKQMMDEKAESQVMQVEMKHPNETRFETSLRLLKTHPDFPKQTNEHDALADARWNKMLYEFLNPTPKFEKLKKG